MTNKGKRLPEEVIDFWPEVFGEVKLNVVPLRYLHAVLVTFNNGKSWEIKVTAQTKKDGWDEFEKSLSELVKNYEHSIENIDFQLDVEQVKKDIKRKTTKFLKKKTI